jgi:Tfp pilus assembly protein PilV
MANSKATRGRKGRQSGMGLIELMIALTVLVVGMLSLMTLITAAIRTNNRNRIDTGGTLIAQMVMERIAAQPATWGDACNPTTSPNCMKITDCNPAGATTWPIATLGAASPGAGATVTAGSIDFNASSPGDYATLQTTHYAMRYVTCGNAGTQATYDVRWNVTNLTSFTKLITVSARQIAVPTTSQQLPYFARPVTLRTIQGQ